MRQRRFRSDPIVIDGQSAETPHLPCVAGAFAFVIGWLALAGVAASAELPSAVAGTWTKQADSATTNPGVVSLIDGVAAIDGEQCRLDGVRQVHARRWYADLTCGRAAAPRRVWLDLNLLAENRMMLNRRPLDEADVYVRASGAPPEDDAK